MKINCNQLSIGQRGTQHISWESAGALISRNLENHIKSIGSFFYSTSARLHKKPVKQTHPKSRIFAVAVLMMATLLSNAATVTNLMWDISGNPIDRTVKFYPQSTPNTISWNGTNVTVMDVQKSVTSTNGAWSQRFVGGIYWADFGTVNNGVKTDPVAFLVPPNDSSTYDFNYCANLATNLGTFVWTNSYYVATVTNLSGNALVQTTNIALSVAQSVVATNGGGGGNPNAITNNQTGVTLGGTFSGSSIFTNLNLGVADGLADRDQTIQFSSHSTGWPAIIRSGDGASSGAEGSIQFAWGLDPVMAINAGENNNLSLAAEGSISNAASYFEFHTRSVFDFFGGQINGNGSGLTNIPASGIVGLSSTNGFLSNADTNRLMAQAGAAIAGSNYLTSISVTTTNQFALKTNAVLIGTATLNGANLLTNGSAASLTLTGGNALTNNQSGPVTIYGNDAKTNSWTFSSSGETRTNNGAGIGRTISLMTGTETWTGTNGSVNYVVYSNANNTVTFSGSHVGNGAGLTNLASTNVIIRTSSNNTTNAITVWALLGYTTNNLPVWVPALTNAP